MAGGNTGTATTATSTPGLTPRGNEGDARGARSSRVKAPGGSPAPADQSAKQAQKDGVVVVALEQFMMLLESGPADRRTAPAMLTLPQILLADIMRAMDNAFDEGVEHGGLFGYRAIRTAYGTVRLRGEEAKLDYGAGYAQALRMRPPLTIVGAFHTHLAAFGVGNPADKKFTGWVGGGPSGSDLVNFFTRDARASIIMSYTRKGTRRLYFMLRPREFRFKPPNGFAETYRRSVVDLVSKGGDPDDVSEISVARLAAKVGFLFYSGYGGSPQLQKH